MAIRIQTFTLDAVSWTAITAPVDCHGLILADQALGTGILIRSDQNDATTQDQILPGERGRIDANPVPLHYVSTTTHPTFRTGETILYAQSAAGTITAVGRFF